MNLICTWGRKRKPNLVLVSRLFYPFAKSLKNTHCYVFSDNFFTSPKLLMKLLDNGIYAIGTVRANRKLMPSLKADKGMSRGEHYWLSCNGLSATKWRDNRSVILLSSYQGPRAVQQIQRRVKGPKDKMNVSFPTVIHEYNHYMGGVDLCDQTKVIYEVDRKSKFRFYLL